MIEQNYSSLISQYELSGLLSSDYKFIKSFSLRGVPSSYLSKDHPSVVRYANISRQVSYYETIKPKSTPIIPALHDLNLLLQKKNASLRSGLEKSLLSLVSKSKTTSLQEYSHLLSNARSVLDVAKFLSVSSPTFLMLYSQIESSQNEFDVSSLPEDSSSFISPSDYHSSFRSTNSSQKKSFVSSSRMKKLVLGSVCSVFLLFGITYVSLPKNSSKMSSTSSISDAIIKSHPYDFLFVKPIQAHYYTALDAKN